MLFHACGPKGQLTDLFLCNDVDASERFEISVIVFACLLYHSSDNVFCEFFLRFVVCDVSDEWDYAGLLDPLCYFFLGGEIAVGVFLPDSLVSEFCFSHELLVLFYSWHEPWPIEIAGVLGAWLALHNLSDNFDEPGAVAVSCEVESDRSVCFQR